jgi:hypothetical protein
VTAPPGSSIRASWAALWNRLLTDPSKYSTWHSMVSGGLVSKPEGGPGQGLRPW